jgi:YVTN family beta-propeller protein
MQRRTHGFARGHVWRGGAARLTALAVGVSVLVAGFVAPPASAATENYTVTAKVAVGDVPTGIAVDPSMQKVWVQNSGNGVPMSVIDATTNTATSLSSFCINSTGLAVDPTTHKVYSVCDLEGGDGYNAIAGYVYEFDETTNTNTGGARVGIGPDAVAVDPTTHTIYVANGNRPYVGTVSVIDATTNTVTATVDVGYLPVALAVDPTTHKIYVANLGGGVSVIDGTTNTVIAGVDVGTNPAGVEVDPTTHKIYVTTGNKVSVIDGTTNAVTATIGVGTDPRGVGVDPTTHTIFVANRVDGTVSVIDGITNTVIATVDVGLSPFALAVDPTTHKIYVANAGENTVSVITRTETDHDLTIGSHPDLRVDATRPSGATVTYTPPTVSDADDPTPPEASCTPAAGGVFAIGDTTVTCTATDSDDSNSPVSTQFTVTVVGAAGQLAALNTAVQGVRPGTSLADTVTAAQTYLAAGDTPHACTTLQAFLKQVKALAGKQIPRVTAQTLTADATRICAVLGC